MPGSRYLLLFSHEAPRPRGPERDPGCRWVSAVMKRLPKTHRHDSEGRVDDAGADGGIHRLLHARLLEDACGVIENLRAGESRGEPGAAVRPRPLSPRVGTLTVRKEGTGHRTGALTGFGSGGELLPRQGLVCRKRGSVHSAHLNPGFGWGPGRGWPGALTALMPDSCWDSCSTTAMRMGWR